MRIKWLDAGRGLAISAVVLVHTIDWSAESGADSRFLFTVHAVCSTFMLPLFFLVSGLLAKSAIQRSWRDLFRSRLLPLLWVFLIWQPVVFAYKFTAGLFLPGQLDTSIGAHLLRLALSPVRPSGELWFLWALAIFIVVAKLLSRVPSWLHLSVALAVSAVYFSYSSHLLGATMERNIGPGIDGLPSFYGFFVLGLIGSATILAIAKALPVPAAIGVIVVWLGFAIVAITFGFANDPGVIFLLRLLGVAGGISMATLGARIPVVDTLGRASMNVYLIHTTFIVAVLVAVSGLIRIPWQSPLVLCLWIAALCVGVAFFALTERGHVLWSVQPPKWLASAFSPGRHTGTVASAEAPVDDAPGGSTERVSDSF